MRSNECSSSPLVALTTIALGFTYGAD
jgi:hypothetical protein